MTAARGTPSWSSSVAAPAWTSDLVIAARNLARTPRRSLLSLAAIAGGVVALILAGGFIEWNLWYGRESTIHSQLGHIRVFRAGYLQSGFADPYRYLLPETSQELAAIEAEPGVLVVAPRLSFSGLASFGDATLSFLGEGLDPAKEAQLSRAVEIVAGVDLARSDADGVVVGEGLAANLGVKPGDRVVLVANTASGGVNAAEVTVRGLFATITKAYDDSAIRLPLALARRLTRTSGAHSWAIVLTDTDLTPTVLERVKAALPADRYEVVPWTRLADFYNKVAALYERQFGLVQWIIGAVILLGITNTMLMSVVERTSEIGTALAIGRRRSAILRSFLLEGALIGIAGGVAGLAIGLILAALISAIGIPMPPSPGMARGFVAGIRVTPGLAVQACTVALLAALAAGVYPAWRASRMNIVDALRTGR
ncbi:MAG: ABC transporter permease [Casimicrobiaceae bacterium]